MARKGKTYRTANGQSVDFGQLLLGNETVPAIGNMNVNARGDEITPDGTISKSREQIMREYNELNTQIPQDDIIVESSNSAKVDDIAEDDWVDWEPKLKTPTDDEVKSESEGQEAQLANTDAIVETTPEPEQLIDVDAFNNKTQKHEEEIAEDTPKSLGTIIEEQHAEQAKTKVPSGGLAAAVARSKSVDNTPKDPGKAGQNLTPGVRRI